jgi:protein-S-isoprenylcysteine O-methyltransferase Ste14
MLFLHLVFPLAQVIPSPWSLLGIAFLLPSLLLNLRADRLFHQSNTTVNPYEESSVLMTGGVFSLSRNPMYLGFVLLLAGVAILFGTLTPFFLLPIFVILIEKQFIINEENLLEKTFGQVYLDYKQKVRRWI